MSIFSQAKKDARLILKREDKIAELKKDNELILDRYENVKGGQALLSAALDDVKESESRKKSESA